MDLSWVSEKFTKGGAQAFLVKPHSSTMKLRSASAVPPGGCWLLALLLAGRPGAHSQDSAPAGRPVCPLAQHRLINVRECLKPSNDPLTTFLGPHSASGTPQTPVVRDAWREGVSMAFAKGVWLLPMAFLPALLLPECS